jgi:hypothetical protein
VIDEVVQGVFEGAGYPYHRMAFYMV